MSGVLAVFAKRPEAGRVKTRLCPPFRPEQAAAFYAALLDDVLEATAAVAPRLGLAPVLAVHPPEACQELAARAPAGFRILAQRGCDLAERMEAAVAELGAAGASPILLRGSDSPTLGEETLREALAALEAGAHVVLCPDRDGGYNLVGLAQPLSGLFSHAMSTPRVLEDTLARARSLGLRAERITPGFDIDTADDLLWLAGARRRAPVLPCRRALAYLDAHALWPPGSGDAGERRDA